MCHWYRSTSVPKEQSPDYYIRRDDHLLIGAPLQHNVQCPYTLDVFENDRYGRLRYLGTAAGGFDLDAITAGVAMGQYTVINISATAKKIPEITVKQATYNSFNNNRRGGNIYSLNSYVGVEISHHTGNAKRVRIMDLFRIATVDRRLDANWKETEWGQAFSNALRDNDFDIIETLWRDLDVRENISDLICQLLQLLHPTGATDRVLVAAYFSQGGSDKEVELPVDLNKWAKCLHDSCRTAAYVVIGDKCLRHRRSQCSGRAETRLETRIAFHGRTPLVGEFVRLLPHGNTYKVLSISPSEVSLSPNIATVRNPIRAYEVEDDRPRGHRTIRRAIIRAGAQSYGGFRSMRTDVGNGVPNPRRNPRRNRRPESFCLLL